MKRFLTALVAIAALAFSTGLGRSTTAGAADEWCWEDPIVSINGHVVHIDLGMAKADLPKLTGTVQVTIFVPQGVPASVVNVDQTYFKENVRIMRSWEVWKSGEPIPVFVSVYVPSSSSVKVAMRITYDINGVHTVRQRSNSWSGYISDWFTLPAPK